jgi:hypothetical protein
MARRPYVHLAGDLSGWPKGFVPTPAFLRNLDQFSSELVNGDEGGTYEPTDPIVLGPYGTPAITLSTVGSVLSGDIETVVGNSRDESLDAISGLVLQSSALPTFQTARTRSVVVGFTNFMEVQSLAVLLEPRFDVDPLTLGARSIVSADSSRMVCVPLPLRAQHRGSTISSVDFRFIIANPQTALPAVMPRFRVLAVSADTAAALHTVVGDYDANGWYTDPTATVATFTNNGQVRTLTYTPDQNHTSIDPSNTFFMAQVRMTTLGAIIISATVNLTAIADYRQE